MSLTGSIAIIIMDRDTRPVDGQLFEVRASVSVKLGVKVREETALE